MKSPRLTFAIKVAKGAGFLSRKVLGRAGEALPGRILLTLAPNAISELSANRRTILVSGTNGKTSTTRTLVGFVQRLGTVATSSSGSNLSRGVAGALMRATDYAVLEVDELHLPMMAAQTNPEVILLLNLTRDQLHRMHEVKRVADRWREVAAISQAKFVVDIDDPYLAYVAEAVPDQSRVVRVSFGGSAGKHPDGAVCPSCSGYLDWDARGYVCKCGLSNRNYTEIHTASNAAERNAVLANVAAAQFGLPWQEVDISALERRTEKVIANRSVSMRLTKNPASWREALAGIRANNVVLILNAREVDGIDTSWLWDVSFAILRGRNVYVTGERALDLAYRIKVEGIDATIVDSVLSAVSELPTGEIEILAAYTAFHKLVNS